MKEFKKLIIEWIFLLNKIFIFVFFCFGVNYISNKYGSPWQIAFFIIAIILVCELIKNEKKRKQEKHIAQNKLWNCLNNSKFDYLTMAQKYDIVNSITEKEYNSIFR
ncbi:MAG: hypothetical protein J6B22_03745 [Clostridia bacterium]|nr:hypothetical protein [Clostridia bacterium]MBO5321704.1 hypothetical protein [Clostridia bacterium]